MCASSEAWLHDERALEIWDAVNPAPGELPFERLEILRRAADAALRIGEEDRAIALAREAIARIDERAETAQAALAHERLGRYCGRRATIRTRCPRTAGRLSGCRKLRRPRSEPWCWLRRGRC